MDSCKGEQYKKKAKNFVLFVFEEQKCKIIKIALLIEERVLGCQLDWKESAEMLSAFCQFTFPYFSMSR